MALLRISGFDSQEARDSLGLFSAGGVGITTGRFGGSAIAVDGTTASSGWGGWFAPVTAASSFIVGFAFMRDVGASSDGSDYSPCMLQFMNGYSTWNTDCLTFHCDSLGRIQVARGRGDETNLVTSAAAIPAGGWHYVEVKATIADAGGIAQVWVDGTQYVDFTGDTQRSTETTKDHIRFGHPNANSGTAYRFHYDDFYYLDTTGSTNNDRLGDVRVETIRPNGNGNSSQWVGSDADSTDNYALIDEATLDTADYVGTSTPTNKDTYAYESISLTAGTVHGARIVSHAQKTDSGAASINHVTRSSASETDSSSMALSGVSAWAYYQSFQETDPNGGGAWSVSAINAAEFGVKMA